MNWIHYVKKWPWILLIVCPLSTLCGQSISGISAKSDSAIRAEFVANAKKINADLIKGDFAQQKADKVALELQTTKDVLRATQASETALKTSLSQAKEDLASQQVKTRLLRKEVWVWRTLAGFTLYFILPK